MKTIKNDKEEVKAIGNKVDGNWAALAHDYASGEEGLTMNNTSLSYFGLTANR